MKKSLLVDFEKVTVYREDKLVLKNISWKVSAGEHHFVLGNNGSGKTTLVELLLGFLWPDAGTIRVLGNVYGAVDLREVRLHFGYLSPWLLDRMRSGYPVEDIIASGTMGMIGTMNRIPSLLRRKVLQLLRFFEMENDALRPYGTLSSGQKIRVVLARALVNDPKILVLDEPFAHLDVHARLKMYDFLEKLARHKKNLSIILITHHLQDILPFFTTGILLDGKGNLQQMRRRDALNLSTLSRTFSIAPRLVKYLNS